jgi:hypothetical protein
VCLVGGLSLAGGWGIVGGICGLECFECSDRRGKRLRHTIWGWLRFSLQRQQGLVEDVAGLVFLTEEVFLGHCVVVLQGVVNKTESDRVEA